MAELAEKDWDGTVNSLETERVREVLDLNFGTRNQEPLDHGMLEDPDQRRIVGATRGKPSGDLFLPVARTIHHLI